MYRRQNQSQQLQSQQRKTFTKRESENPAYDRQSVYDDIIELDQKAYGPYDVPDDGACYDELNETYDHTDPVPGPSTPVIYDGLNAGIYDQPDAGPALPDRPTHNPSQYINQETTAADYLELINVDDEQNQTAVHLEPTTTHAYLELIHVDEDKNQTAEC